MSNSGSGMCGSSGYCAGRPVAARQISILASAGALEALDQHPVAVVQLGDQLVHGRFGANLELADLGQAPVRRDHHFERPRLPMPRRYRRR